MATTITYKIVSDSDNKLRDGAKLACNFWNAYVTPATNMVMRLETFDDPNSTTIASAYKPWTENGVKYGRVRFNLKFLKNYTVLQAAGTIAHELGHVLGYGWADWDKLFDQKTGKFNPEAIKKLAALKGMLVELDGDDGTKLSHWDEDSFDLDLMSPYKDDAETVLPVTIDVVGLLGHKVHTQLAKQGNLDDLLKNAPEPSVDRKALWSEINIDSFQETPVFETLPQGN